MPLGLHSYAREERLSLLMLALLYLLNVDDFYKHESFHNSCEKRLLDWISENMGKALCFTRERREW